MGKKKEVGNYIIDLDSKKNKTATGNSQNIIYEAVSKNNKNEKKAIKVLNSYQNNNKLELTNKRLDFYKQNNFGCHQNIETYISNPSEISMVFDYYECITPANDFVKKNGPLLKYFKPEDMFTKIKKITDDLIQFERMGTMHNEVILRNLLVSKIAGFKPGMFSSKKETADTYDIHLKIPSYWVLYNEMYYNYNMQDLEIVAPEILMGSRPTDVNDKQKVLVWALGVQIFEILFGKRPFSQPDSIQYATKLQKLHLSAEKKLAVLIRDKSADVSKISNPLIISLFEKVFVTEHHSRINLSQLSFYLGQIIDEYLVKAGATPRYTNNALPPQSNQPSMMHSMNPGPPQNNMMNSYNPNPPQNNMMNSYNPGTPQDNRRNSYNPQMNTMGSMFGGQGFDAKVIQEEPAPQFNPEGNNANFDDFRARDVLYQNFTAIKEKNSEYNPLDDLMNDRPLQDYDRFQQKKSDEVAKGFKMPKATSEIVTSGFYENRDDQVAKLKQDGHHLENLHGSTLIVKPADIDDLFSDCKSTGERDLDFDDTDEGARPFQQGVPPRPFKVNQTTKMSQMDINNKISSIQMTQSKISSMLANPVINKDAQALEESQEPENDATEEENQKVEELILQVNLQIEKEVQAEQYEEKQRHRTINKNIGNSFMDLKHEKSKSNFKNQKTNEDYSAEKLYFARLRIRQLVHKKITELFYKNLRKNVYSMIFQFQILKHACFLYDELREKLQDYDSDENPFIFESPQKWTNFTNTQSFQNILDILLQDTDDTMSLLYKRYATVNCALDMLPQSKKMHMNNYINMQNFDFSAKEWNAIDLLCSMMLTRVLDEAVKKEKDKQKRINLYKLQCFILIMQAENNLGIWQITYPFEEFADEIRVIDKLEDEGKLITKQITLQKWG